MIEKSTFTPFHHYDFETIDHLASTHHTPLVTLGNNTIGEHFLTLKNEEVCFSFVSVDKNDSGMVYMCVFNGLPFHENQYRVIRTTNDDFLVHVNHQYGHYDSQKTFVGKLSYHLYQLAKNTLDNEQIITAHSTLEALHTFEKRAPGSEK